MEHLSRLQATGQNLVGEYLNLLGIVGNVQAAVGRMHLAHGQTAGMVAPSGVQGLSVDILADLDGAGEAPLRSRPAATRS